jgi:cytochrome c oxidase assembly protein subunit 15
VRIPVLSAPAYRRVTAAALVALGFIIVTGAAVRLTGSGLGCPEWPTCEAGSIAPRGETGVHGVVEFVNRLITGVVSVAVMVAVLGSLWRVPRRRDLTGWSLGLVVGVAAQAVLGGIVVRLDLAPVSVIGHFLLSMVLVWNAVVLHHKAGVEPEGARRRALAVPEVVLAARLLVVAAAMVIASGTVVTASGPHGGDEEADRLDLVVGDVARLHGIAMVLFLGLAVATLAMVRRGGADPSVERRGRALLAAIAAQGAIGYTQYFAGVPALLVGVHVLGAVVVWVAVLRFLLGMHVAATPEPAVDATPDVPVAAPA